MSALPVLYLAVVVAAAAGICALAVLGVVRLYRGRP